MLPHGMWARSKGPLPSSSSSSSSPPPLTHSLFLFPSILPSFSISLSRRTASGLVGVRTTDRDRICVVPLHPSGVTAGCGRAGIISGVPRGIWGGTEERWPRDITRELRECDVSSFSDNRRGLVGEGK